MLYNHKINKQISYNDTECFYNFELYPVCTKDFYRIV